MCVAKSDVRFAPNSDRESGLPQPVMSALPPKADMCSAQAHVRFGPKADIAPLFDNLVGSGQQYFRDCDAEYFCGLEIYDHFEFSRLLDWYLRRLLAPENLVDVESYSLKHQRVIWRIAKQHPRSRHLCSVPHNCDVLFDCKLGDCASFIPIHRVVDRVGGHDAFL